jgi:hypothetical protein
MAALESGENIRAEDVMRFHRASGLPVMFCKQFLSSHTHADRIQFIAMAEANPGKYLHDPIEDDPAVHPLFLAICDEAHRAAIEWSEARIAELESAHPVIADMHRCGRGLCHVIWHRVKALMLDRHGIKWRSPREINTWVIFD